MMDGRVNADLEQFRAGAHAIWLEIAEFDRLFSRTTYKVRQWTETKDSKTIGTWWAVAADSVDHSGKLATEAEARQIADTLNRLAEPYLDSLADRLRDKMRELIG